MKFAFSTLGCPSWAWEEVLAAATDLGYDGVEIRGVGKELYAPKSPFFQAENLEKTKALIHSLNLEIPCLTTACYLYDGENSAAHYQAGCEYIDLAQKLNVPYIRVLGDLNPQPELDIDISLVADNLLALADYAKDKNVTVLLESNGVFADSHLLAELMELLARPEIGVLWDVHHPFRYCLERIEETYANLKPYLRHIHMKDSVMNANGQVEYRMMGGGDIPNRTILNLLLQEGYDGYVSFEWTKRWNKNLLEPGIVFPQFINYVRTIADKK